ncbi:MerR family transcriptional regulator [Actinocatenispora comari]|uniref:MerR family transcriptional regulator n=1 Tax=Actinocatenispora comari TaxID=2807577 RepID=A0A8J4A583_9ACTN|nr:MerR family transcriptional regulator [Actinocatenispora comari]GIL25096.1 MerR family transcriptional regulator [Actinocatenispora comari]
MDQQLEDMFDDDNYPAYTMGQATELVGVSQDFLRSLETKLLNPHRSTGGHRRYSRYQLRLAARARALVDEGTAIDAACRIIILEDQLAEAQRLNRQYQQDNATPHRDSDDPQPEDET